MIGTNTTFSVQTGVYTDEVIDIARSCLEGCYTDYYFFQYSSTEYVLLVGEIDFQGLSIITGDVAVYDFVVSPVSTSTQVSIPFSGSQSGSYGGSDGAGGFNGSVTGNSTLNIQTDTKYNVTYTYLASASDISITNSDSLVYGSADYLPHLIEGVQYYAFAAFCFAVGIVCFKLVDRIFRRVY